MAVRKERGSVVKERAAHVPPWRRPDWPRFAARLEELSLEWCAGQHIAPASLPHRAMPPPDWLVVLRLGFDRLFGAVAPRMDDGAGSPTPEPVSAIEIAIALAAIWFGPREPTAVARQLNAQQRDLLDSIADDVAALGIVDPARVLDVVLAWGLGTRGRSIEPEGDPIAQARWAAAMFAVRGMVEGSVRKAGDCLRKLGAPDTVLADDVSVRTISDWITGVVVLGQCTCAHLRGKDKGGKPCRHEGHDLRHWNPVVCSIHAFLAQAVRGSAEGLIRGNAFAVSILAATLSELEAVGNELWFKCEVEGCGTRQAYDGREGRVPECEHGHRFDPHLAFCDKKRGRLIWIGTHEREERLRCRDCGNLFDPSFDSCPRCGGSPTRGITRLYVRI